MDERLTRAALAAIEAATVTAKALAEDAGVHWTTIARWRSGKSRPSPESAQKLARVIRRRALEMLDRAAALDAEASAEDHDGKGDR